MSQFLHLAVDISSYRLASALNCRGSLQFPPQGLKSSLQVA